jgi:hypothetical protein
MADEQALRPIELMLYYGCWKDAGHFLHDANGSRMNDYRRGQFKCPLGNALDSTFAPPFVNEREDATALTHIHNWTVLSMWDRSVDNRPGSNCAFVAPGRHTQTEMLARAGEVYPFIVARLKARRSAMWPNPVPAFPMKKESDPVR